jgi:enoyl-CoA hydratase
MPSKVTYARAGAVATLTMDDGKANALSPAMLTEINEALDQAAADAAVVVLAGRPGRFSGGFDLAVLRAGGPEAGAMVRGGFALAERLLSFPTPVVVACTGHAVAMGAFLVLSGDYRVGTAGPYKLMANEVAIGLTVPDAAIAICRARLAPPYFDRVVVLSEAFTPEAAVDAGFLDRVVDEADVLDVARATAADLAKLDMAAHAASKLRARHDLLAAIRSDIA